MHNWPPKAAARKYGPNPKVLYHVSIKGIALKVCNLRWIRPSTHLNVGFLVKCQGKRRASLLQPLVTRLNHGLCLIVRHLVPSETSLQTYFEAQLPTVFFFHST